MVIHATMFLCSRSPILCGYFVDDNVDAAPMLAMLVQASGHHVPVEHGARAGRGA
jgi:hypothetical protein